MDHAHHHHHNDQQMPTTPSTASVGGIIGITTTGLHLNGHNENDNLVDHSNNHDNGEHQMKMYFHGGFKELILFDFWRIDSFFGLFSSFIFIFLMGAVYEGLKWFRVYFQLWTTERMKLSGCLTMNSVARASVGKATHQCGAEDSLIDKSCPLPLSPATHQPPGCAEITIGGNTLTNQEVYGPTVVISTPSCSGMQINRWTWLMMYVASEFSPSTCRLIETSFYALQLVLAYWLMLIAMTFNIWLTFAVIFGAAFGHWLFANVKCAPPRRCFCQSCGNGNLGRGEHIDNFASDACH